MSELKDTYTIMIFRGSLAGPLRFTFSRSLVKTVVGLSVCLVLVELLLLSQVVLRIGEMWELKALRAELMNAREQTTAFSTAVEDLKRRLLAMKEVNQRLRVMLGIDTDKPDDSGDLLNGRGGEPGVVDSSDLSNPGGAGQANQVSMNSDGDSAVTGVQEQTERLQRGLEWLQHQAGSEERVLQELAMAAESRRARWAATPSIWPVKGWITSGFGQRISPFTGQPTMHEGLDIGAPPNAPVQSPAAGRVIALGFDSRMGNIIAIDHGYGIETQYGHLAKILVKNGQTVKRGDVIGLVGSTGLSTGPHLHYLVKVNGRPVNPQRYILE